MSKASIRTLILTLGSVDNIGGSVAIFASGRIGTAFLPLRYDHGSRVHVHEPRRYMYVWGCEVFPRPRS